MDSKEAPEGALATSWTIPQVAKNERVELSFEIKGKGEVDAETLNQFHGVTFGDEVEDDEGSVVSVVEETSEETPEEVTEESDGEVNDDSSDEPGAGYKWREDVLVRIMEEHGIAASLRDEFIRHAVNFDYDNNMYLKKVELENAAAGWEYLYSEETDGDSEEVEENTSAEEEVTTEEEITDETVSDEEDVTDEEEVTAEEEVTEEEVTEEEDVTDEAASDEDAESKVCMICSIDNSADATECNACGFVF
jgi:ribosomal protein L40E